MVDRSRFASDHQPFPSAVVTALERERGGYLPCVGPARATTRSCLKTARPADEAPGQGVPISLAGPGPAGSFRRTRPATVSGHAE